MPKIEHASVTFVSTGNEIIVLNDSSLVIEKILCHIVSSTTEHSDGYSDSVINFTSSSAYGDKNTSNTITHYRSIGGVKTKVFEAKVPTGAFTYAGEFNFNVTTWTQNTKVWFTIYGS